MSCQLLKAGHCCAWTFSLSNPLMMINCMVNIPQSCQLDLLPHGREAYKPGHVMGLPVDLKIR